MDIYSIVGIAGLILILVAFALNLFHYLNQHSKTYNLLNVVGSGCLAYYALLLDSLPFLILQIVWGLLSLINLIKILFWSKK